jgi:hypothetical protein
LRPAIRDSQLKDFGGDSFPKAKRLFFCQAVAVSSILLKLCQKESGKRDKTIAKERRDGGSGASTRRRRIGANPDAESSARWRQSEPGYYGTGAETGGATFEGRDEGGGA